MPPPPVTTELLTALAVAIHTAGGQAVLVGGCVRDALLGLSPKDYDLEVFGLSADDLRRVLSGFGPVKRFGASFPVFAVRGLPIDFTLPRAATFAEAARHRDLTINSIGREARTGELLDPHNGEADLRAGVLRATDPSTFGTDPLRLLRVAQLAARLNMRLDPALVALCRMLALDDVPGERLAAEFNKLLLVSKQPGVGLRVLQETGALQFFPALAAMHATPQDPRWHPEGDVWAHTIMVVDEAAALRNGGPLDSALMFGALLHDVGKPVCTKLVDGHWRARNHDVAGVPLARAFLERLRASRALTTAVEVLVRYHLAPAQLPAGGASDRAYRRLVRELTNAGVDADTLLRLGRADALGRTTTDALARRFTAGDAFSARIAALRLEKLTPDAVLGRHLLAHGYQPGPAMGDMLRACRDVQDENGWDDPERIIAAAAAQQATK